MVKKDSIVPIHLKSPPERLMDQSAFKDRRIHFRNSPCERVNFFFRLKDSDRFCGHVMLFLVEDSFVFNLFMLCRIFCCKCIRLVSDSVWVFK